MIEDGPTTTRRALREIAARLDALDRWLAAPDADPARARTLVAEARAWLETARAPVDPDVADTPIRRARVLVIDDEPLVGRALRRALAEHEVVAVQDARQGLAMCLSETWDVVFCDVMMPEFTGLDVHEALREQRPDVATQIVFITGGAFTTRARTYLDEIANTRIDKPFDLDAVRRLVRERSGAAPG